MQSFNANKSDENYKLHKKLEFFSDISFLYLSVATLKTDICKSVFHQLILISKVV